MQGIELSRWFSALAVLIFPLNWGEAALSPQQKRDGAPATQRQQHEDTNQQQTNAMGQLPDLAIFGGEMMRQVRRRQEREGHRNGRRAVNDTIRLAGTKPEENLVSRGGDRSTDADALFT